MSKQAVCYYSCVQFYPWQFHQLLQRRWSMYTKHTLCFNGQLPLNSPFPFTSKLHILLGQAWTFHVILNKISPGLLRTSSNSSLQLPISYNVWPSHYHLSISSFHSICPNHINLHFLIIKLTGSNHKSSPSSSLFFLSLILTPYEHTCFGACVDI